MAAPRRLSIVPDVKLKIEIVPKFRGMDHTDSSSPWKFKITNLEDIFLARQIPSILQTRGNEGLISPTSRITLPRTIRLKAGIPEEATSFAFMYPPLGLAENLKSAQNRESAFFTDNVSFPQDNPEVSDNQERAIKSTILLGGFAYFDDELNCVRINGLSRETEMQKLSLSGPFPVHIPAYEELHRMGRTQSLRLHNFREAGYESFAWVRPLERFRFKPVFNNGDRNPSGSLLFFREDRTAIGYAIDASGFVDYKGDVDIITEVITSLNDTSFNHDTVRPLFEISAWKEKVGATDDTGKLIEELEDKRTLLHKACHAALGAEFIAKLISSSNEASNLSYVDDYGWTPLHYACRFSPSDDALIMLLVNACPAAVLQSDHYNRSPIHIACDSHTSEEVLTILLGADSSGSNDTLYMKTEKFGFLPLHLACYRGASHSVIKTLLDADHVGETVITKTNDDHLPLHLAILKQLSPSTVKLILESVSKIKMEADADDADAGVYEFFQRKLPIHLACWNNSPSEMIDMLLEKDTLNITTTLDVEPKGRSSTRESASSRASNRMSLVAGFTLDDKAFNFSQQEIEVELPQETVALHLAMKHNSAEVIRLLLQKELKSNHYSVDQSSLYKVDRRGRTPLHIACEFSTDPIIIQELVNLDTLKRTLQFSDKKGFRPMHYACEHENSSTEIIKILSETEARLIRRSRELRKKNKNGAKPKKRSTFTGGKEHNRTPLYLALKSDSPVPSIDILMEPDNFTLDGLDGPTMDTLSEIAKISEDAQQKIIDILTERKIFCFILIELYANVIACAALMYGSKQLLDGEITRVCPSLLILSSVSFIQREILQIISVSEDYISDIWSWSEIACIIFLLKTAGLMFEKIGDPKPELPTTALCVTGFLLVLQVISYLRSTFLPFARFVGGLIMILARIVPFFIVSLLLLGAFIYSYYVTEQDGCETFYDCFLTLTNMTYNFGPAEEAPALDFLFGIVISIVILNVVIAIVSEAWDDAATESTTLFWLYRLEKINEFQGLGRLKCKLPSFQAISNCLAFIDNLENISFQNEIAWSQPPYDNVTSKAQYEKPQDFFDPNITRKILEAKSLNADLYFGELHSRAKNDMELPFREKFNIIARWLGRCIFYLLVVFAGILSCGILFPKNFRSGILSYGVDEEIEALSETNPDVVLRTSVAESKNSLQLVANRAKVSKMNVEKVKSAVDMAEEVVLKRHNLRTAGVSEEEIDATIPVAMIQHQSGIFEVA